MSQDSSVSPAQAAAAREVAASRCVRPYLTPSGALVSCRTRSFYACPHCALVFRRDWSQIIADGVTNLPAPARLLFVTFTAPSFGRVHRIPSRRDDRPARCGCGRVHSTQERHLRGVPVDGSKYDYLSQARWNRDAGGSLWRYTLTYLRRALPEFAYVSVRELQLRGTQHMHVLLRLPGDTSAEVAETVREVAAGVQVTAFDGFTAVWGEQVDVRDLGVIGAENSEADAGAAHTVRYIGKVIGYMAKDLLGHVTEHGKNGQALAAHLGACEDAARAVRCSPKCPQGLSCTCPTPAPSKWQLGDLGQIILSNEALSDWLSELPKRDNDCPVHSQFCKSDRHTNLGASAHTITVSRTTAKRQGWSLSGYTRTGFQESRKAYAEERAKVQAMPEGLAMLIGVKKPKSKIKREYSDEVIEAALRLHRRALALGVASVR